MTRVGRVPVDSTSEAEGKATLTGSLVNVYELSMAEEWLGIWGIAGFGTGASDLTTADGGFPDESLLSWLGAAGQRAELWSGGDAQQGLGAEAGAELRYTHTGIGLELEAFGRHVTGSGDAGYRFGFGGTLEY